MHQLRTDWYLRSDGASTRALRLNRGEQLELAGEIHHSLWGAGNTLGQVATATPELALISRALGVPPLPLTIGNLLRGVGWGTLFVELSGRCNERCVHCYASSSPQVVSALSLGSVRRLLQEAHELGFHTIQLTGGDPLVAPHFVAALELAASLKFLSLQVYTNGLIFDDLMAERFQTCQTEVLFSMYSHEAAVHDRVTRVKGSHARTSAAIRRAVAWGIPVSVGAVLGCVSGQDETELREYVVGLGVAEGSIKFDWQRSVGRGSSSEKENPLPGVRHDSSSHSDGRGKLAVLHTGEVVPCIFDRSTVLGDIESQSLDAILSVEVEERSGRIEQGASRAALKTLTDSLACLDCRARRTLFSHVQLKV